MRLGTALYRPRTCQELDDIVEYLDVYGLSAVAAPRELVDMTDDEAIELGAHAAALGLVLSDAIHKPNLMTPSPDLRGQRIELLRTALQRADLMGCQSVITLVGTVAPEDHLAAPHPYMFSEECAREFRDITLRVMDGLDLKTTKLLIEPWTTSFFYQPPRIRAFLEAVDHPSVGVHLDVANMVSQDNYYSTTALVEEAFELLFDYIGGVHFKDIRWDWEHMLLKFDEVPVGQGVIDYERFLAEAARLGDDVACFCEHLESEERYAVSLARLRHVADRVGVKFIRRS
jgi:sugar phosphate isomerase/epimerase